MNHKIVKSLLALSLLLSMQPSQAAKTKLGSQVEGLFHSLGARLSSAKQYAQPRVEQALLSGAEIVLKPVKLARDYRGTPIFMQQHQNAFTTSACRWVNQPVAHAIAYNPSTAESRSKDVEDDVASHQTEQQLGSIPRLEQAYATSQRLLKHSLAWSLGTKMLQDGLSLKAAVGLSAASLMGTLGTTLAQHKAQNAEKRQTLWLALSVVPYVLGQNPEVILDALKHVKKEGIKKSLKDAREGIKKFWSKETSPKARWAFVARTLGPVASIMGHNWFATQTAEHDRGYRDGMTKALRDNGVAIEELRHEAYKNGLSESFHAFRETAPQAPRPDSV
jgi:hypothetical protein